MQRGTPIQILLNRMSGGRVAMPHIPDVREADEAYEMQLLPDKEKDTQRQEVRQVTRTRQEVRQEPPAVSQENLKQRYRQLNSAQFRKMYDNFDAFKEYLQTGEYPPYAKTPAQKKGVDTAFGRDYYLENGRIFYRTSIFNLEVMPSANQYKVDTVLRKVFDNPAVGMGHGIRQFYKIIADKYLNITRKQCEDFLKRQVSYQLTRPLVTPKNPTQKYYQENQCWATDLIDVSKYIRYNEPYMYIMTCQDVFTKKCWLRKLESKTAEEVIEKFKTFMTATHKPKILKADNGETSSNEFKAFIKTLGVKLVNTMSNTPQSNIENLNGQVRKMLQQLAVRKRNLVWHTELEAIENNLNNYNELTSNEIERKKAVHNHTLLQEENKKKTKAERDEDDAKKRPPKFKEGDYVRLSQRAFIPEVRAEYKQGTQKSVMIKYSIIPFQVIKVFKPIESNGFNTYRLYNLDAKEVLSNKENNAPYKARESDLLKIPAEEAEGETPTLAQNNLINSMSKAPAPLRPSKSKIATRSKATKEKQD